MAENVKSENAKSGLSTRQVGFAVANLILGNAIFTVPYCFVKCGWSAAVVIVLSVAGMLYTGALLCDVLSDMKKRHVQELDYGTIGEVAIGQVFRPVFSLMCVGECFNTIIFFLVFSANCLASTCNISMTHAIWISAFLGFLFTLIPKRFMAGISACGIFLVLGAVVTVLYSCVVVLLPSREDMSQSTFGSDGLRGVTGVMGAVAVGIGDHAFLPNLFCASASPEAFRKGLAIGYYVYLVVALLLGLVAYATYGVSSHPVVLTNIGTDAYGMKVGSVPGGLSVFCNVALAIRCVQVLPAILDPMVQQLLYFVRLISGADVSIVKVKLDRNDESPWNSVSFCSVTVVSLISCAVTAVSLADFIFELVTVIGALFKSVNAFVIPCYAYLSICGARLEGHRFKHVLINAILMVGLIYGVVGTTAGLSRCLECFIPCLFALAPFMVVLMGKKVLAPFMLAVMGKEFFSFPKTIQKLQRPLMQS